MTVILSAVGRVTGASVIGGAALLAACSVIVGTDGWLLSGMWRAVDTGPQETVIDLTLTQGAETITGSGTFTGSGGTVTFSVDSGRVDGYEFDLWITTSAGGSDAINGRAYRRDEFVAVVRGYQVIFHRLPAP